MLVDTYRRLRRYGYFLHGVSGPAKLACIARDLIGREAERTICVGGVEVIARLGSPDLDVAISAFYHREYDAVRCDQARVVVDAGANIGTSAMYFARRFPGATVYAIEPERGNYGLLCRNTAAVKNVVPVRAALWGAAGSRPLIDRGIGHWGYAVAGGNALSGVTVQEVDCITVDQLMQRHGIEHIDILKMDIEGGEKDVLEHAGPWIDRVRILTAELHDRFVMGCDRAFYLATKDFQHFERHGEKITAYRDPPG